MHSYYLLIHISQGQDLSSISKKQKLYICSKAPPLNCCMLIPHLLDLPCLNIFVHFAKSLKHLLPPPLLLGSRMYLPKTLNDFPYQKPILPSFGLTPAEHLSQYKEVSGLQFLVIPIFFAFLCFPFHCTGLWQSLKSSLTEHGLISHQFTFAVSDYSQVPSTYSLLQVCKFLIFFFLQPVPDLLLNLLVRLCCIFLLF